MANLYRFQDNDVVNDTQKVAVSTWTNNVNNLTTAHTSSAQANFTSPTASGAFYIDVYNEVTSSTSTAVQYSVAYGHRKGSGSLNFTNDTGAKGKSATGVTYSQYRNLVYGDELTNFSFDGYTPDDIYIININRSRYRHNLKPGTLNLYLTGSEGGVTSVDKLHLTDDSVTQTGSATLTNIGRQYNIVSGANGERSGSLLTQVKGSGSYGFFYPDAGLIILNARALSQSLQIEPTRTDNATPDGHAKMYRAISGAAYFIIDSEEKISSQYYFVRCRNHEFNYTTNPSFIDTQGAVNFDSFIDNPTTYITTIGLYNDSSDLVAVAKVSQPVVKDFTKEALIRVKLDY
tara:strand:- start:5587 stop:6624 length:1038 start_codon:yes stop_codon:yes gene_type:complete